MISKIAAFVLVSGVLIGVLIFSQWSTEPLKVSGVIEADEIRLGSRVGGRVRTVHIEEGHELKPGDLLIELDPFDLLERRAEADAHLAERRAEYRKLKSGYRQEEIAEAEAQYRQLKAEWEKLKHGPRPQEVDVAKAELKSAADLELQKKQFDRTKSLYEKGVATKNEYDESEKGLAAARALLDARQEQLDLLLAGTREEEIAAAKARMEQAEAQWQLRKSGYREEEIDQAHAARQAAQHVLAAIERQIDELAVTSPVAGTVQAVDLQAGDLVNANSPALSLLDSSHLWIRAYVPEDELDLEIGQKVNVTVDSYPEEEFAGEITFVAKQAEFTPRNVQTPEERSKQVFRIKINLVDGLDRLRPGMGADVWLEP